MSLGLTANLAQLAAIILHLSSLYRCTSLIDFDQNPTLLVQTD